MRLPHEPSTMRHITALALLVLCAPLAAQNYYIPDSNAASGTSNVIPFGSSSPGGSFYNCRMQVRADLFDKPVVGGWLHRIGCIPTSTAVREQAEDTAVDTLGAGSTVAVMPEGRLVPAKDRPEGVGQGRTGVSRIAERSGAHIVPVAIHGSDHIWPIGRPVPKLGVFRRRELIIRLGTPIEFPHDDHQDNADHLMETIAEMLREIERDLGR